MLAAFTSLFLFSALFQLFKKTPPPSPCIHLPPPPPPPTPPKKIPPAGGAVEIGKILLKTDGVIESDQMRLIADALARLDSQVGGLQDDVATLTADNAALKADSAALRADSAALKADNVALKADTVVLKADNAALKTRVDDLEAAANDGTGLSEGDLTAVKTNVTNLAKDLITLQSDVTDLNSSIANGPASSSSSSSCQNYFGDSSDGVGIFSEDTQFPSTEDGDMVVKQFSYLRISSLATLTTSKRCKGLLIYVDGDMDVYGKLTMTARGAAVDPEAAGVPRSGLFYPACTALDGTDDPHLPASAFTVSADLSGCGAAAEAVAEKQANLLRSSGVTSYRIAREGADGATAQCMIASASSCSAFNKAATPGPQATDADLGLKSGGGGSGGLYNNQCSSSSCRSGGGGAGTCFSGGAGGAGKTNWYTHQPNSASKNLQERPGSSNGGAGGEGFGNGGSAGGAGNPGGFGGCENGGSNCRTEYVGGSGTGGLLMIIVRGQLTIYPGGEISSEGSAGGQCHNCGHGGGSGGGNILILTGNGVSMETGLDSGWMSNNALAPRGPLSVRGGESGSVDYWNGWPRLEDGGLSWGGDGSIRIGRIDPNLSGSGGGSSSSGRSGVSVDDLAKLEDSIAAQTGATLTNAMSHVVYGDEFYPGGEMDFTEGSASLAILKQTLPGTKVFLTSVTLTGVNVKASVVSELMKDVTSIGGILYGKTNRISFANSDGDLEFASLISVEAIELENIDGGNVDGTVCNRAEAQGCISGTTKTVSATSVSFPVLEFVSEDLKVYGNNKLKSISIPKLKRVGRNADFYNNPLLAALDLQNLVAVGTSLSINDNPSLPTSQVQVSKDFLECGGSFSAGYGPPPSFALTGLECTPDNGLKAVVAAAASTYSRNPQSCKK